MPWGKIDDSLYDHPKVELLGDQDGDAPASWKVVGAGVLLLAISWCNANRPTVTSPCGQSRRTTSELKTSGSRQALACRTAGTRRSLLSTTG
jgi:hypothetical protein